MKTLIELYDERPIENVLATEMLQPEEMILVCPPEIMRDRNWRAALADYFKMRGCPVKLSFAEASLLDAVKVEKTLKQILESHEDCAFDISGGSDAALFAAGAVAGDVPVFTYSRKKNAFFEIRNAPFARNLPCTVRLDVRACVRMAGGELLPGREDNRELASRLPDIGALFSVFSRYRGQWNRQIAYLQHISRSDDTQLRAEGPRVTKAERSRVTADEGFLRALQDAGLIRDLVIEDERVSFVFRDPTVRFWLRDVGAVLELQVYRACLETGVFDDTVLSAVISWDGKKLGPGSVSNEIDVMAVRGIEPVFISCKTCEIHTEALNELAILRDRFGGKGSRAVIVTSAAAGKSRTAMRRRAQELGIEVIEWGDLALQKLTDRLKNGGTRD